MKMRKIQLSRKEVTEKLSRKPHGWILAIDPETLATQIIPSGGYYPELEGHEDLFPLGMCVEREDGFLEGGDWTVAQTSNRREHDGIYRSYWIEWKE
jgi:hypothetical protein